MTNKQFLEKLTPEELVQTYLFTDCPYGEIYIQIMAQEGKRICPKREKFNSLDEKEAKEFIFSGKTKEICNACKLNWLSKEKE